MIRVNKYNYVGNIEGKGCICPAKETRGELMKFDMEC